MTKLLYNSIGETIQVSVSISELSQRDKVALFHKLGEDLGIWARFNAEPDGTKRAQLIMQEQLHKNWNA